MTNLKAVNVLVCVLCMPCGGSMVAGAGEIPPRPEQIEFAPMQFEPPDPAAYRHELSNGVAVYLAPSQEFPLINLAFTFRGGSYLDPADGAGLADATGAMMRRGGAGALSAQELDEELDFLAAQASVSCGDVFSSATLNCLKSNLDQSLALFMSVLREPRFQPDRLEVYKGEVIERLKQRNDDADPILRREWSALLYGREHFEARQPRRASIESIAVDNLRAMHQRIFHPARGHLVIAVTGDFEPQEMLSRLEKALAGWKAGQPAPPPPAPQATFAPGVYHVEKDIPQGKVYVGLRGIQRDDPDYFPVLIMNHILGGGGFTSRITTRVRSDEGLAYSAGSTMIPRIYYPGEIRAGFQSKNPTVALAIRIILDEIERLRNEPVSREELQVAQNSFIETFPRTFESKAGMLAVFVNDELTNRPADFWKNYRQNIRAVTVDEVKRVAQKHLAPASMAIFVVGRWDQIEPGDLQGRAKMNEFFGGQVTHLPLRDPLTLEPLAK